MKWTTSIMRPIFQHGDEPCLFLPAFCLQHLTANLCPAIEPLRCSITTTHAIRRCCFTYAQHKSPLKLAFTALTVAQPGGCANFYVFAAKFYKRNVLSYLLNEVAEIRGENWNWGPWEVRGFPARIFTFSSAKFYSKKICSYLQN